MAQNPVYSKSFSFVLFPITFIPCTIKNADDAAFIGGGVILYYSNIIKI